MQSFHGHLMFQEIPLKVTIRWTKFSGVGWYFNKFYPHTKLIEAAQFTVRFHNVYQILTSINQSINVYYSSNNPSDFPSE